MKTIIYFFITNIIAVGSLLSALDEHKNIVVNFVIAFGVWALFLWGWYKRMQEADAKREREERLKEYLSIKIRDCKY